MCSVGGEKKKIESFAELGVEIEREGKKRDRQSEWNHVQMELATD